MTPYRNAYRSPLGFMPQQETTPLGFGIRGSQGGGALPDLLTSLGMGLLMGKNPAQGLGYGLQQFQQLSGDRRQEQRQARRDQMDQQRYDLQAQQYQTEADAAAAAQKSLAERTQAFEGYVNQMPVDPGVKQFILSQGPDSEAGKEILKSLFPDPAEPPKSRTRDVGDKQVFEEWDPSTKSWKQISDAPRWAPKPEGGSLSLDINGDGVPDFTMGQGAAGLGAEWKTKDNNFANRLDNAIVGMDKVEAEGYDPTATSAGGVADYIGQRSVGGLVGNAMTSDKGKEWYRNAKEALAVILRKDTGAAVTDNEFELYGPLYIPMPWDDQATKASKKQAILVMRNSLRQGLGQTPVTPQGGQAPDIKSKYGLE